MDPEELVGLEFEMPDPDDGKMKRMTIMKEIEDHKKMVQNQSTYKKFMVHGSVNNQEEIVDYNDIIDHTERQREEPLYSELRHILSHQGHLPQRHRNCNGSPHNVRVEWENGEITDEPLNIIAEDAPVACAIHAKNNNLLNKPGWK